jgi:hypothetical protein
LLFSYQIFIFSFLLLGLICSFSGSLG